jgi:hypothetical protein
MSTVTSARLWGLAAVLQTGAFGFLYSASLQNKAADVYVALRPRLLTAPDALYANPLSMLPVTTIHDGVFHCVAAVFVSTALIPVIGFKHVSILFAGGAWASGWAYLLQNQLLGADAGRPHGAVTSAGGWAAICVVLCMVTNAHTPFFQVPAAFVALPIAGRALVQEHTDRAFGGIRVSDARDGPKAVNGGVLGGVAFGVAYGMMLLRRPYEGRRMRRFFDGFKSAIMN